MALIAHAVGDAWEFEVAGIPKAQPRPRATVRGGRPSVFNPATAEGWKALILIAARSHRPASPIDRPVSVRIDFLLHRPKSLCRRKDPPGEIYAPCKPDRDNLEKAVLDTLESDGWFRNDSIVVAGEVRKLYHAVGGRPGARIRIEIIG